MERVYLELNRTTEPIVEETKAIAREAIAALQELGDDGGSAVAWLVLANCHNSVGEFSDMLIAGEKAMNFARRAGDERTEWFARLLVNSALVWGPMPASQALVWAESLLKEAEGRPAMTANAYRTLAAVKGLLGQMSDARTFVQKALDLYQELGSRRGFGSMGFVSGQIEIWARDFVAAERQLRSSCEALEELGENGLLSTAICILGNALIGLGRLDEADQCAERGRQLGASDDFATQLEWRLCRAAVLLRRGRTEEAEGLAREGLDVVEGTESLNWQAQAREVLSEVLATAGRTPEARDLAREALMLYERKGNVLMIEQMRAQLARLGG
jgi:tetratricopeptide (TPR) repeat protein